MRLSTLFACLLAAAPAAGMPAAPPHAVVLVVAGWCAPCRAELARRAEIEAAAAPRTLRIVALDDTASTRAMLAGLPPSAMWRLTPADRVRLADSVYARSAGLPYAFATDPRGQRCADLAGGLDAPRTRALVARCPP